MVENVTIIVQHDMVPGPIWERSEPPMGAARTQFNRLEKDNARKRKIMHRNNYFVWGPCGIWKGSMWVPCGVNVGSVWGLRKSVCGLERISVGSVSGL